jgi:exonuclease VII small subunit
MEAEGHGGAGPRTVPLLAAGAAAPVALGYTITAKHELNESEAKLEKAKTELEKAEAKLEKAKTELGEAKTELGEAKTELEKAEAKLKKAEAKLKKAKGTDDEESAKTYYAAVLEGVTTAQRGVTTAQTGVDTAQTGVGTAQMVVAAATDQVLAAQKCERSPCTSYCRTLTVSSTSLSSPSQRCTKLRAPMTLFPLFATFRVPCSTSVTFEQTMCLCCHSRRLWCFD